jgi:hypothetical protein
MDKPLLLHLSNKKYTKLIALLFAWNYVKDYSIWTPDNIYHRNYLTHEERQFKGKICKGKLRKDINDFKKRDIISARINGNNITIYTDKDNLNSSYILCPEKPTIEIDTDEENKICGADIIYIEELTFFFKVGNKYDKKNYEGYKEYKCICSPLEDIGILKKNKDYIIHKELDITIYDIETNKFICYIRINYPIPILIENKAEKL